MAFTGRYVYNSLFGYHTTDATHDIIHTSDRYQPSVNDVFTVKEFLREECGFPLELIDVCIDYAQYWPHTSSVTPAYDYPKSVRSGIAHENEFLLRSYPLGFLPSEDGGEEYQMLPEYVSKYQTMTPKPWGESREALQNITDDILKQWTRKSVPRAEFPCRKIVFTIKSHDQGWGGGPGQRGTYHGSSTWFDIGLERMSSLREDKFLEAWEIAPWPQFRLSIPGQESQREDKQDPMSANSSPVVCSLRTLVPGTVARNPPVNEGENSHIFSHNLHEPPDCLQKNVTAIRDTKEHVITWSCDDNINPEAAEAMELEKLGRGRASANGEFVRNMKLGDVVTVWAKARFHGWVNVIDEVKIDVYWAV